MCILDSIFSAPDEARNLKINDKISLFLSLRNIFWDGLRNGKIRSISCRERGQSQRRYKTSRADNEVSQNFHNIFPAYYRFHTEVSIKTLHRLSTFNKVGPSPILWIRILWKFCKILFAALKTSPALCPVEQWPLASSYKHSTTLPWQSNKWYNLLNIQHLTKRGSLP